MKQRHLLFSADLEVLGGNGPSASTASAPAGTADVSSAFSPASAAAPEASSPLITDHAAPVTASREPTRLELIAAAIRDKGAILAENNDLKAQLATVNGTLTERETFIIALTEQLRVSQAENTTLRAEIAAVDATLKTTEAKVVSIDQAAAREIAAMGFEPEKLPAAEAAPVSVEALIAKMNATTDPAEKYNLAAQVNKLESASAS